MLRLALSAHVRLTCSPCGEPPAQIRRLRMEGGRNLPEETPMHQFRPAQQHNGRETVDYAEL